MILSLLRFGGHCLKKTAAHLSWTVLALVPQSADVILAGIGPFVRVFSGADHSLFPQFARLAGLVAACPLSFVAYAEATARPFSFSQRFATVAMLSEHVFPAPLPTGDHLRRPVPLAFRLFFGIRTPFE
jgi:hypothetical protein